MSAINRYLDLLITDKQSGEEWQCSYDHAYIENLTHKTGNYKPFDTFIAMIKSGLLKTSESISLELLTFEDLDSLRTKKIRGHSKHFSNSHGNNKRYLIVTYSVEFDRIHYPLPLEYCGPPDPSILQATIRKLEADLTKAREENLLKTASGDAKQIVMLQRRIEDLLSENMSLRKEIRDLSHIVDNAPNKQVQVLQRAIVNLEKSVLTERRSHHKLVEKLRSDKVRLVKELEKVKSNEKSLKTQLDQYQRYRAVRRSSNGNRSDQSLETIYRRLSPVVKAHSDGNKNARTRSVSPRLTKSAGYENNMEVPHLRFNKSLKQRSRSSSLSSSRNRVVTDNAFEIDAMGDRRSIGDRRKRPSKETKFSRSRSTSVHSTNSSGTEDVSRGSVKSIKAKIRNSKKEFQCLENRIHALQNILKENLKSAKDF